jgi:hypothetical protein
MYRSIDKEIEDEFILCSEENGDSEVWIIKNK